MQSGYLLTFSTEGNTVGKVVGRLSDVGRLVEFGRAIRLTRRVHARHIVYPTILLRRPELKGYLKPKGKM